MTLEQTRYEKLFSTPVFRFRVPDHAAFNAALLEEGAGMRADTDGAAKSNRGGWHSEGNLFDRDTACVTRLRRLATEAIFAANERIGAQAPRESLALKIFGWMNANPKGAFNAPHTHPGAHWSGVYYVAQPEIETGNSGMIEFVDPRSDLPNWRILQAPPFRMKQKLRPAPGEMILFPSYLVHWVYPNDTDDERWSIAFNATFRKART
ncbi:TIGR02466 family protein [Roseovarius sp. SYSU LYC5161]|uniref:TIGR02466 family protein n=1 Tax=Roseovarius halophilus (ex Wu et al. 2025) TaxID=3376060 RepID=UPI00399B0A05